MSGIAEQYLIDYLAEEFRRDSGVRLRVMREDGELGVSLKTESREYFFPFEWSEKGRFKEIQDQVKRVREAI